MIFKDSRYSNGTVVRESRYAYNPSPVMVYRKFPSESTRFFLYEWKETDRIDLVARQYLAYSHLWWKIMDVNPEILNPMDIAPGTVIRIPNV